ncbi:uncharacterized protein PHALS_10303 [Plasmopara halstedii]|uniref:Uncharacterized protein n=1 Tax=Plasmopara halstedii TaxID=4781 RepID=A0A0N7L4Z9_PLAHL|nr:uncharacterized protein PHALS_10303 [Plasmopara halstedii]CEG40083.1 hypothetical protein PHALS_10303 [Plasmopara halstedii]|eukprot:XP_024576452.1 hypothetical protein PHALS_10303 [Plasmopara halstedii]
MALTTLGIHAVVVCTRGPEDFDINVHCVAEIFNTRIYSSGFRVVWDQNTVVRLDGRLAWDPSLQDIQVSRSMYRIQIKREVRTSKVNVWIPRRIEIIDHEVARVVFEQVLVE